MRSLLVTSWLLIVIFAALDLIIEAARHDPWRVLILLLVLALMIELRDTITKERP